MTTLILVRGGRPFFHGGVLVLLAIALVALVVACWPGKTNSK
ncbi:MAG: hypothetical protein ABSA47_19020 [Verrucomicrobiota bacterium]|jgi:hypothetical protein